MTDGVMLIALALGISLAVILFTARRFKKSIDNFDKETRAYYERMKRD